MIRTDLAYIRALKETYGYSKFTRKSQEALNSANSLAVR